MLAMPMNKAHAMAPKTKAFLVICTYGTVGGALLGFASMAFGTNSRAIAQGASLGLYAGIAFGAYVISTHGRQNTTPEVYEPQEPPPGFNDGFPQPGYNEPGYGDPSGGAFGAPPPSPEDEGGFFGSPNRALEINEDLYYNYRLGNKKGREISPPIYIHLFQGSF
ncbi:MAG: hypothetical protein CME62_03640 [Halobacteriovoraceae bacterium]|nr:hypothetical protein [Halobacteriovoraceae bacterium]